MTRFAPLLSAALLAATSAAAGGHHPILAAQAAWEQTLNGRDRAAAAAHFTPDARLMPQEGAMVQGSDAIAEFWGAFMAGPKRIELDLIDLEMSGDTAIGTSTFSVTRPFKHGGEVVLTGKTLVTWKRGKDGFWRIDRSMWHAGM